MKELFLRYPLPNVAPTKTWDAFIGAEMEQPITLIAPLYLIESEISGIYNR